MTLNSYVPLYVACLTTTLLLTGCSDSNNDGLPDDPVAGSVPTTILDDDALENLEGIYERRGYGDIYVYEDNRTIWYTLTENTCLEVFVSPGLAGFAPEEIAQARYDLQEDQLSLLFPGEAFVIRLNRLEALPSRCDDAIPGDTQTLFDFVWSTFDEYYAFFDLRDVDWSAQYAQQAPRVGEVTDNTALFDLLADLLSPIDDGHVFVANGVDFFTPAVTAGAEVELREGFEMQSDITEFGEWASLIIAQFRQLLSRQLDADSVKQQGPLSWGTAEGGSTGYLFIERMEGYALDEDGEPRNDVSAADDLAAASAAMDRVMADLADTTRLIIDVRFNSGGNDAISFDFARRFISDRQLAFSKTARSRDFESAPVEAWLEPLAEGAYLKPVSLIIGPDTVSAAETFVIPMHRLPQVTLIGEATAGALSDILFKPLPNGWTVGLSNEVYLDSEGVSFEGEGISPDIDVPVFRLENIQMGVDPALERALSLR